MTHLRSVLLAALATSAVCSAVARGAEPTQQPEGATISYATLDESIKALRAKPDVTFRSQDGWMVAEDTQAHTVWLFTPPGHPAYPSMVKRTLVNKSEGAYFDTNVRCLASKDMCDKYFGGK